MDETGICLAVYGEDLEPNERAIKNPFEVDQDVPQSLLQFPILCFFGVPCRGLRFFGVPCRASSSPR